MKRILAFVGAVFLLVVSTACGDSPSHPPSQTFSLVGPDSPLASTAGISCSDATPTWISPNQGPIGNAVTVFWNGERGEGYKGYTYLVVVDYNRSGVEPLQEVARFRTNRTEASIKNTEDGGRYYVKVRLTHNPCGDVLSDWSKVLTIYFDGRGGDSSGTVAAPAGGGNPDNGSGNDDSGDDIDDDDDDDAPPVEATYKRTAGFPGIQAQNGAGNQCGQVGGTFWVGVSGFFCNATQQPPGPWTVN